MKQKGYTSVKAVDFDGTLSEEGKYYKHGVIGKPIKPMVKLVNKWIKDGEKVVIFTSRMCTSVHTSSQLRANRKAIQNFCVKYFNKVLPMTAEKHPSFEYWDNKAHRVEDNTGKILAKSEKLTKAIIKQRIGYASMH